MKKLLYLPILFLAQASWGTWAFVQSKSCTAYTSSVNCAFDTVMGSGNLLVAFCGAGAGSGSITINDNNSGSYTTVGSQLVSWNTNNQALLSYAPNHASGATTVTCGRTGASQVQVSIHEYSGIAASSPMDVYSSSITMTNAANPNSSPMTTTGANRLVFNGALFQGGTASSHSGTVRENYANAYYVSTQDTNKAAAGSIESTMNATAGDFVSIQAAFCETGGCSAESGPTTGTGRIMFIR